MHYKKNTIFYLYKHVLRAWRGIHIVDTLIGRRNQEVFLFKEFTTH